MVAYIVNFTDPEVTPFNVNSFTTDGPKSPNTLQLNSSAVKASTGLLLYGKGHPEYGERIQENLVNLMENFSGATEPTFPISGQTWFSRITYVLIGGVGSPGQAEIYRWSDTGGGSWTLLIQTAGPGTADPTVADQVKTIGAQPTTIIDGSFWLDTVGSPLVPELYLAVNSASSNLSATFLKREMDNLTGLITTLELTSGVYQPQKQLKVYDGAGWKNSGSVFTSKAAPQNPAIGDLWYQTGIQGSPPVNSVGSPLQGGGGPLSQLFIWARPNPTQAPRWLTTGYLDRSGDVMTGPLSFGLPTSSLFIWEGQGNVLNGADLRMTGDALLTATNNFYIHIDDSGSPPVGNNIFEIATGSRVHGSPFSTSLFQVQSDGVIRSALALGSPNAYKALILASDENALTNRAYVDELTVGLSADVASNEARITVNEANIEILNGGSPAGGSPIQPKVSRIGDTMTGALTIDLDPSIVGSPFPQGSPLLHLGSFPAIDVSFHKIIRLADPTVGTDAANRQWVESITDPIAAALGSPMVDKFVDGISLDWVTTDTITLTRTGGLVDLTASLIHSHGASTVQHTVGSSYLRDTFQESEFGSPLGSPSNVAGSPPKIRTLTITQDQINETALTDLNTRASTLEAPTDREIIVIPGVGSPGGSPVLNLTSLLLTEETYEAGLNRLQVYVNGVKQYANERAYQKISFSTNSAFNLSSSARTLLPFNATFTLNIAVDGGGSQVASALGKALQLYQDIIDLINSDITGATAVWSERDTAIVVYSDTTGTGSAIDIADGGGSPLTSILLALSTECVGGIGSPFSFCHYTIGNISPTASGPVSTIVQNLAYREVVDYTASTVDATFGQTASSVIFTTSLNPGDVIELLAFPA